MVFKELSLYKDRIVDSINSFSENTKCTVTETPKMIKYTINVPEEKEALLSVYPNKNGTATIYAQVGKNTDLSLKIAHRIIEQCTVSEINAKALFISKMEDDEFEALLEYLDGDERITIDQAKAISVGKQFRVNWSDGGSVFINRFNSGSFSVQGSSNILKEIVFEGLTNLLPYQDTVSAKLQSLDIGMKADDVLLALKKIIPNAFDFLGDPLKAIISAAIVLKNADLKMLEYSAIVFPALKGLEGYIKKLFLVNGIEITGPTLAPYIESRKVKPEHVAVIKNQHVVDAIEQCYAYYSTNRHILFHIDGTIIGTRTIDDIEFADSVINETFSLIENTYSVISKK
ncbi:RNase LS family HEPN domain-containing protein [Pedobacter sp. Leaf170]|uniref:RNase LS family HEPN domain-containing protein n=1 Tax=Pedobacter sp. Leaf170 TaxID=2876558 RepID=UPI001E46BCD2|nr:RNase LS family HEPN domain-containing protein [Pedobacter sp. Leaf170]